MTDQTSEEKPRNENQPPAAPPSPSPSPPAAPPQPSKEEPASITALSRNATEGIGAIKGLTSLAFPHLSEHPGLILAALLLGIVAIVMVVALIALAISGTGDQLVVIVGVFCCLSVLVFVFAVLNTWNRRQEKAKAQILSLQREVDATSNRLRDIEAKVRDQAPCVVNRRTLLIAHTRATNEQRAFLVRVLKKLRQQTLGLLQPQCPTLKLDHLRVNVFLPDYENLGSDASLLLSMPAPFRVNMLHEPEWDLAFLPGQGVCGTAFRDRKPRLAARSDAAEDAADSWKRLVKWDHPLTPDQRDRLHEDLEWVVAVPILSDGAAVAIVNIDGLHTAADTELLTNLVVKLTPTYATITTCLSTFPKLAYVFRIEETA